MSMAGSTRVPRIALCAVRRAGGVTDDQSEHCANLFTLELLDVSELFAFVLILISTVRPRIRCCRPGDIFCLSHGDVMAVGTMRLREFGSQPDRVVEVLKAKVEVASRGVFLPPKKTSKGFPMLAWCSVGVSTLHCSV